MSESRWDVLWAALAAEAGERGSAVQGHDRQLGIVQLQGVERVRQVSAMAFDTVQVSIDSAVPYLPPANVLREIDGFELRLVEQGVQCRTVYPLGASSEKRAWTHIKDSTTKGAQIRTGPVGETRFSVFDDVFAIVSSSPGTIGPNGFAHAVNDPGLISLLSTSFESIWSRSISPWAGQQSQESLTPVEIRVLQGLALALTDREISEQVDRSTSAVERTTKRLKKRFNCDSRTSLALLARSMGWGEASLRRI